MSWIEIVRNSLKMEDVLQRYIGQPNRMHKYLCPFHQDRHPSLSINPRTDRFTCFACGAKGDLIDFVERYFNTDQRGALEILDRDFNLGLENSRDTAETVRKAKAAREQERKRNEEIAARVAAQIKVIRIAHSIMRDAFQRTRPAQQEMEAFMNDEKRVEQCMWYWRQEAWLQWLDDCLSEWEYDDTLSEDPFHFEMTVLGEMPTLYIRGADKENFTRRKMRVLKKLEEGEIEPICKSIMT